MGVQLTWLDVGWLSGRVGSDVLDDLGKRPPGRANLQSGFAIPQLQCNPTKRRTRVVQVWGDNCATSGFCRRNGQLLLAHRPSSVLEGLACFA